MNPWQFASLLLAGCACARPPEPSSRLLWEVRAGLTEREAHIQSLHLSGTVSEGGQQAPFEFWYRGPNRMRGSVASAAGPRTTFSFDGTKLFELSDERRALVAYAMKLTPAHGALVLTQTFAPLCPEGFRTPLIPREGVSARRLQHPDGPEAVELAFSTRDEAGAPIRVQYALRWPGLDFLAKRLESGGHIKEVRGEEHQCDARLRMCFPRKLTEWTAGALGATTVVSAFELNPALPADAFTLALPEGYRLERRELTGPP